MRNEFKTDKYPLDIEGAITVFAIGLCFGIFVCTVLYIIAN